MTVWTSDAPLFAAAFLASVVEFAEALTVVMAAGIERGWRSAVTGALTAMVFLGLLVAVFGPALQAIPLTLVQLAVGILLLLFGTRWLRKAILRAAGVISLHDEEAAYRLSVSTLGMMPQPGGTAIDAVGFLTAFKIVMLEGLEVVFIVIAIGTRHGLAVPVAGAAAALVIVVSLGLVVRRPLSRVPENTLKFAVGVLLTAFGTFWAGEGLGAEWPGADMALPMLVLFYLVTALAATRACRQRRRV